VSVGRRDIACLTRGPCAWRSSVLSLALVRARIRSRAAFQRTRRPLLAWAAEGLFTGRRDKVLADSRVASISPVSNASVPSTRDRVFVHVPQRGASLLAPARCRRADWWARFTAPESASLNRTTFWCKTQTRCRRRPPNLSPLRTLHCCEVARAWRRLSRIARPTGLPCLFSPNKTEF